jgi:hypothetical protein
VPGAGGERGLVFVDVQDAVNPDDRADNADFQAGENAQIALFPAPKRKPFCIVGDSVTEVGGGRTADYDIRPKSDALFVEVRGRGPEWVPWARSFGDLMTYLDQTAD